MAHNQQVLMMLFLMLGPFKLIVPFVKLTQNGDKAITQKIALHATLYSILGLLVAALVGENVLSKYGIPIHILAMAGGIILFLVALLNVISQFDYTHQPDESAPPPTLGMAMIPLAFPTIVTPYGAAAVIVFMTMAHNLSDQILIGGFIVGIMILNLIVMLTAKKMFKIYMMVLPVLGAVLGVIQVALGLQIIVNAVKQILAG